MSGTETTEQSSVQHVRRLHRWRMAFFGVVILLAGFVIGGASVFILAGRRPKLRPIDPVIFSNRALSDLQRGLDLTPEQSEKVGAVLQKNMQGLHDIRIAASDEINEQLGIMNEQISAVLTEQQERIWRQRLNRLGEHFRPGGFRGGSGGQWFRGGRRGMGGGGRGPGMGRGGPGGGDADSRGGPGGMGPGGPGQQERERFRRGPGPYNPERFPSGPNFPRKGMNHDRMRWDKRPFNPEEKPLNADEKPADANEGLE